MLHEENHAEKQRTPSPLSVACNCRPQRGRPSRPKSSRWHCESDCARPFDLSAAHGPGAVRGRAEEPPARAGSARGPKPPAPAVGREATTPVATTPATFSRSSAGARASPPGTAAPRRRGARCMSRTRVPPVAARSRSRRERAARRGSPRRSPERHPRPRPTAVPATPVATRGGAGQKGPTLAAAAKRSRSRWRGRSPTPGSCTATAAETSAAPSVHAPLGYWSRRSCHSCRSCSSLQTPPERLPAVQRPGVTLAARFSARQVPQLGPLILNRARRCRLRRCQPRLARPLAALQPPAQPAARRPA